MVKVYDAGVVLLILLYNLLSQITFNKAWYFLSKLLSDSILRT